MARNLAKKLRINRANFLFGKAPDLDWSSFSAFYLFNPFWDNVEPSVEIVHSIQKTEILYEQKGYLDQKNLAGCRVNASFCTVVIDKKEIVDDDSELAFGGILRIQVSGSALRSLK